MKKQAVLRFRRILRVSSALSLLPICGVSAAFSQTETGTSAAAAETAGKNEESERSKELNTLRYGLDDEIIALLDSFLKENTYPYRTEIYELFGKTKSVSVREKIIAYFTQAADPCLSEYALAVAADPFDTRKSTVSLVFKYVSALKLTEAAGSVRTLLENENEDYFDAALSALGDIGSADDAVFIAEYLDRTDLSVARQQSLMKVLGKLKAVETWDALVEIAKDENRNSFVRMYAAEAIGTLEKPESVPVLAELFETSDPNFRASVVKGLSNYTDKAAEAVVIEAIRDAHYKVRLEAVAAVKKLKLKDAEPSLLYRAKNDPEASVKYACYDALGFLGSADGNKYLVSLLKDAKLNDTAKTKAAAALVEYGNASGTDAVIDLARSTLADDKKKSLRYALGKLFASTENGAFAGICGEYLASKDVATVGTGLDIYAKNRFPSLTAEVKRIAEDEKAGANRTKARKILDRE